MNIANKLKLLNLDNFNLLELDLFKCGQFTIFVWNWDDSLCVDYVSDNVVKLIGFNSEDFYSNKVSFFDLVNDLDKERFIDEILDNSESDTTVIDHKPYRLRKFDNSYVWVSTSTNIIRDQNGKIVRYIGIICDISKDKENELNLKDILKDLEQKNLALEASLKEVKESDEKFKIVADNTYDLEIWETPDRIFKYISPSCERITGYQQSDFYNNSQFMFEIIDNNYKSKYKKFMADCLSDNSYINCDLDFKIITRSGEHKYLNLICKPIFDSEGVFLGTRSSYRDITERKNEEEQILILSQSIEQTKASIVITDNIGDIKYVNKKFSEITGYSFEEVVGRNTKILKSGHQSKEFYKDLWDRITQGKEWKGKFLNKKKNGDFYWELSSISPILNSKNEITQYFAIKEDITDQMQKEEYSEILISELQESQLLNETSLFEKNQLIEELVQIKEELEVANSEKDKFFSIIAHDLKSPFSGFLNLTKMMADDVMNFTMKDLVDLSKSLRSSADSLYKLLENLLEWSRIKRGITHFEPEFNHLFFLVESNINILQQTANIKEIELINNIDLDIEIFADIPMIYTVLRNLMSNATKFTPKKGTITIFAEKSSDKITITIQDTGIGMSEDILSKLFKLDEKVSRPGTEGESSTGLGLLLCKEFIEKHKGKIWVESEINKGSKFMFSLPINDNIE